MKKWSVCAVVAVLMSAHPVHADEGLNNFGHLTAPSEAAPGAKADPWGPIPGTKLSVVNFAPGILAYFNNGPVFGLPGTVTGDIWDRTQLTGDWGGARTALARQGIFLDMYSTSVYQDVTSGGLKTGSSFVQNNQISLNIDTGRAGMWPGGIIHVTAQQRYGDKPENTFTAGASVPHYTGLVFPGPEESHHTLPTEYYLVQALSKNFSVVLGKISNIFIPDQTMFANSYKYHFANFNFNKNPMTPNFYNPVSLAALGVWAVNERFAIAGGVLDPNSTADTLATDAFDKVNLYIMSVMGYDIGGLPGMFSPAFNWSNKPKINLETPFGAFATAKTPVALAGLLGLGSTEGLPVNYRSDSWFAIANISQYLWVKDAPADVGGKLKGGQLIRGVGLFGRVGYAPEDTNTVTQDYSIGLFAHGLLDSRPYDSLGVGVYHNVISSKLKDTISRYTRGAESVGDETGMEVFYSFALTPAVRVIPSYQHIWNPLAAQVADGKKDADIFLTRVTVAW